ncbi:RING finger protein B [Escovopsis weberi]|uniref:RING finger protein B n=1 Tax=Escovopsis weberi TaxID=150374 RepID=A0A0M8NAB3_ESCWE|nr:RING finger protein B [Escovopsis weberi]
MNHTRGFLILVQALLVAPVLAQFSNWQAHQVDTSICIWEQPRAALVGDVVYLDGGDIYWRPVLDTGQYGDVIAPENYQGIVLSYNLSVPFSTGSNTTGILLRDKLSKAPGGLGNINGASPNYYDGAMLANDAQFFLYGGAPFKNDQQYELPDQGAYIEYQASQYGPVKPQFQPGFHNLELPENLTRYVAYGGAASAPSENKAWYFSGLTSPTRGSIEQNGPGDATASNASNTLIAVDMGTQNFPKWSNKTLPSEIRARSNAAVVWVPVGGQGILVVIGGTTFPDWADVSRKSYNESQSKILDAAFMQTIDIYDVESDTWYQQSTNNGGHSRPTPSARSRGCAVVAPASDFSSINIFYYGGYDGLHPHDPFFDEVWALSLPSFSWSKINAGKSSHARAGHQCFSPYPDQMMVFGGSTSLASSTLTCLENGPVLNFNLTSGEWMDSYDPAKYGAYGVHDEIRVVIGGSYSGGSEVTQPPGSGWDDSGLGAVFAKAYDRKKLTHYWPYVTANATSRTSNPQVGPGQDTSSGHGHTGLPKWAGAMIGVLAAVAVLACVALIWFLRTRRRQVSNRKSASTGDISRNSYLSRIMGRKASPGKSIMSMSSVVSPISPDLHNITPQTVSATPHREVEVDRYELPETTGPVELDSEQRMELQDTGLSRPEIWQRYSHWLSTQPLSPETPSEFPASPDPLSCRS